MYQKQGILYSKWWILQNQHRAAQLLGYVRWEAMYPRLDLNQVYVADVRLTCAGKVFRRQPDWSDQTGRTRLVGPDWSDADLRVVSSQRVTRVKRQFTLAGMTWEMFIGYFPLLFPTPLVWNFSARSTRRRYLQLQNGRPLFNAKSSFFRGNSTLSLRFQ